MVLLVEMLILKVSALIRLAATSKESLVRVEGSKNRFTMVRPLRAGTFLMDREEISLKDTAVASMCEMSSAVNWPMSRMWR